MDISESFRVEEDMTKPSDLFDFVVNASDGDNMNVLPQFNRSLKSLGIYLETSAALSESRARNENVDAGNSVSDNNNNSSVTSVDKPPVDINHQKEPNNNHLLIANGTVQYADGSQTYWAGSAIKDEPEVRWDHSMLEDLNCWNQENGPKMMCNESGAAPGDDTDGAIYTLTVLNGTDHGSTWYRLPDDTAVRENDTQDTNPTNPIRQATPSAAPSIDFDSLLNNILPNSIPQLTNSSSFPSYLTVNSQEILPPRDDTNEPTGEAESSPMRPTEYLYEDAGYRETNGNSREPLRIPFCSSTENPSSNHSGNTNCSNINNSSGNNSSDNPDWKISTESNRVVGASTPDGRASSLLRNALQGKTGSFASRYNGAHTRGSHSIAKAEKPMDPADASVAANAPVFADMDDARTHSPLMAVSLEGGTVVMFDGGRGAGSMLVDSDNPSSAQSVDDIFLSQLDAVGYGEDYEKLKSIENEVAESVERFCTDPYFGPSTHLDPNRVQPLAHHLDHTMMNPVSTPSSTSKSKKYSKRASNPSKSNPSHPHQLVQSPSGNTNPGGVRKERSLHYCAICHKGFKDKYSVNVHVRTHTGEKPFTCTFCGKNFRQKAHLAKHHHTHSVQKSATPSASNSGSSNKPQNNKHR